MVWVIRHTDLYPEIPTFITFWGKKTRENGIPGPFLGQKLLVRS